MTSFICGHTGCSGPVHLVLAHKCRQNQVQTSLDPVDHGSMATVWGTARRSQEVAWENCLTPDSHCPVEMSSSPGTEDPSYALSVKRLSVRILFPRFPPTKSGQRADIFPLYIFVFSPLNFCLSNMLSVVIWETLPYQKLFECQHPADSARPV